jgi:hypothetical protein
MSSSFRSRIYNITGNKLLFLDLIYRKKKGQRDGLPWLKGPILWYVAGKI